MSCAHFADEVITRVRALGHPLCVGLDPHLELIPRIFRRGSMDLGDPETVAAVGDFMEAALKRLRGRVAVVKPQSALFEQLGVPGLTLLGELIARARRLGMLVLLDAKRGDIGSTAEGYARAYLDTEAPFAADALTVSPYLGLTTLSPYLTRCHDLGRGLFVLVKTSNEGSGDLQDLMVGSRPLFMHLAAQLASTSVGLMGPATGWSSLGVVVGANYPEQAIRVREALPRALFLIPGYGAQGGTAAEALRSFVSGPSGLEGGLVNSSRGVLYASSTAEDAATWERAFDAALARAVEELGVAVARSER